MLKKGFKLNSILTGTCPRCHQESMYKEQNPYKLGQVFEMHDTCSHCKLRYKIEPSFFYGAMYVSYGVSVAFGVAAFIITYVMLEMDIQASFLAIVGTLILFFPIILRISRNIWINFFVSYDENWKKNQEKN
jgi:uncharacterized protein (DUF983 family)